MLCNIMTKSDSNNDKSGDVQNAKNPKGKFRRGEEKLGLGSKKGDSSG